MVDEKSWYEGSISQEGLRERASQIGKPHTGQRKGRKLYIKTDYPVWGPDPGERAIRILRPLEYGEIKNNGMDFRFHRNVGPNRDFFVCPNFMWGKDCPYCQLATDEMWRTNKDLAKKYSWPDHRVLLWVIDLQLEKSDDMYGVPQVYPAPKGLYEEILARSTSRETGEFLDVGDPKKGVAIYFSRVGEGIQTRYTNVELGREPVPVPIEVVKLMARFSDVIVISSYEEIKAAIGDYDNGGVGGQRPAQAAPEQPPCFGEEFGRYAECDSTCTFADACREKTYSAGGTEEDGGFPTIKGREEKTDSKERVTRESEPESEPEKEKPSAPTRETPPGMKEKIEALIEKRKGKNAPKE